MAIDTLRPGKAAEAGHPGLRTMAEPVARRADACRPIIKSSSMPPGADCRRGWWPRIRFGHLIGNMGPVNFDGVCFQRYRDLHCVDPLTGQVVWIRKNVPFGCDVFGDEELLFVAPPEGGDALVLRALDGQLLGKRHVRPLDKRMATIGRDTLEWGALDSNQVVSLRDSWTEETSNGRTPSVPVPRERWSPTKPWACWNNRAASSWCDSRTARSWSTSGSSPRAC